MKIRMILMALAALLCLTSCSDDDSGIQLTEDEVIGDIITGKQIVINTLTTYTDGVCKVNVNGAKGKVSATSSMIVLPRFRVLQMNQRRRYT